MLFLNCLLLDLTFIDLISIVHTDKIWFQIANRFYGTKGGGGGGGEGSVISDTPGWPPIVFNFDETFFLNCR